MPQMLRLCALDLDDTLLNSEQELTPASRAAVAAAVDTGMAVVLASGRMQASAAPFARELDLTTPMISYNGAMVSASVSGPTWLSESVPEGLSEVIVEECVRRGLQLNFYWNDLLHTAHETPWLQLYRSRTHSPVRFEEDFAAFCAGKRPTKLLIVDAPATIDRMLPEYQERFGEALCVTKSNAEYLEFLPPEANKGSALRIVAERLGVRQEETLAIGDSWNDIPMLRWAGLALAVENCKPAVRAVANEIIGSCDEDGVAAALMTLRHRFGPPPS
ncbi:MAG: HAD family phosphatase [Armatimonadetes bacterium]|nr:HAD family phosphatase [Armatimonadota bacterium]MDE2207919.1 HAD family phosphatase [Armatimonadota bacterium]